MRRIPILMLYFWDHYTDIIFPSYDVRFIAINDGADSNRGDSEGFAAIRNLFNEWYPRDTSKKVRVSLR